MASDAWWRFYNTAPDHPKILSLTDAQFRAWAIMNSLASKMGGEVPGDMRIIALAMRKTEGKARELIQVLLSGRLLDKTDTGYRPHNWDAKQFKSDNSTDRVKRFRERSRNAVTETDQRQRHRQKDQSSLRDDSAEAAPLAPPVIALPTNLFEKNREEVGISQAQIDDYATTYPAVDVLQKLREMRRWLIDNPTKRKTARGMGKFVNAWLSKEQDKGPSNGHRNAKAAPHRDFLAAGIEVAREYLGGSGDDSRHADQASRPLLPS